MDCPFCAIVEGRLAAHVVAETSTALAFLDLRQAVAGHVLVVPRRHVEDIYALEATLAGEVMALATHVARALHATYAPPGLNLWQSNGDAGGQEVPHFHLHVHPRHYDDGLLRVYPHGLPLHATDDDLDAMARRIRLQLTP